MCFDVFDLSSCVSRGERKRVKFGKMVVNVGALGGRLSFIIKTVAPARFVSAVSTRPYSIYPPTYIKPTYKKEQQNDLIESGEVLKIAHTPILPAHSSNTSSEFHDDVVIKFTNFIMRKGKKKLARDLLQGAFENVKRIQLERYHKSKPADRHTVILDPVEILHKAVINSKPVMELLKMKKGGAVYQVPIPLLDKRQRFLAMNWLIEAAKDKHRKVHLPESLARELIDAAYNQGRVVKRKQDLHKQCEANRAYAHYRWS